MMTLETSAFVLRYQPLGESDRIVTLFSRKHGQLRGVAPRAAASRKRFGGALSVLAEVEVRFLSRPGRDLGRLESCIPLRSTPGEGRDLEAYYASVYIAEVLGAFTHEGQVDERLYRLTGAVATALADGGEPSVVCRYFEVWTLKLAGLLPDLERCPACQRELATTGGTATQHGEVLCTDCDEDSANSRRHLSPTVVRLIHRFLAVPPAQAADDRPRAADVRAVATFAAALFLLLVERPFRSAGSVIPRRPTAKTQTAGEQK